MRILFLAAACAGCSAAMRERPLPEAIDDGVAFLVKSQQPDGSWGTGGRTTGWDLLDDVPGSHHAFRDATTSLCVLALRAAGGAEEARRRGLEFLLTRAGSRRSSGGQIYNVWAHCYMTHALAVEARHDPGNLAIREACARQIRDLERYQTVVGGWNYYDGPVSTTPVNLDPTSFGTAATLVALWEAREAGIAVPDEMVRRAIRRLEACRFPDGSYAYGFDGRREPMFGANQLEGSIGRAQACNEALWLWGRLDEKAALQGLADFFRLHKFILIGRKRQFPHEAWYYTAPYYYYFGHYYAGRLLGRLSPEARAPFLEPYRRALLPYQEDNGSWWDYIMWDYHEPYGTAFVLLGLTAARR